MMQIDRAFYPVYIVEIVEEPLSAVGRMLLTFCHTLYFLIM
jgi:hypothetical protein